MFALPSRSSDSGPIDRSSEMDSRDYIDLAIEALELAKFATSSKARAGYLSQADDYLQSAERLSKEGK